MPTAHDSHLPPWLHDCVSIRNGATHFNLPVASSSPCCFLRDHNPANAEGMRFSLFVVSLWIVFLSLREGACQEDELQRMGDPVTEKEEVEEQIKEVVHAPPSRIHDGSSSCAAPEPLPRVPMPAPRHFPGRAPRRQPLPLRNFWPAPTYLLALLPWQGSLPLHLFMPALGHLLACVPWQGPFPWHLVMPAPGYLLAYVPWQGPLPWHSFMLAPGYHLAHVPWQGPLPWHFFMTAPLHLLACVPWPGPLPWHSFVPAPGHLARVPRREPLPLSVPIATPSHTPARVPRREAAPTHLQARVPLRAAICKFLVDVEAAGKHLLLLTVLQDWNVSSSYPDLIASVEQLFRDRPDLLATFNIFLPEGHQCIVPEAVRE